jgi:hypothetical protein
VRSIPFRFFKHYDPKVIEYIQRRIVPKITSLKQIEEILFYYSKNQYEKGELSFSNATGMLNKIAEKALEIA